MQATEPAKSFTGEELRVTLSRTHHPWFLTEIIQAKDYTFDIFYEGTEVTV